MINRAKSMLNWRVVAIALGIFVVLSMAVHSQVRPGPTTARPSTVPIANRPVAYLNGIPILQSNQAWPVTPPLPNMRPGGGINANGFGGIGVAGNSGNSGNSGNGGFGGNNGGGQGGFGGGNNGGFGGGQGGF